MIGTFYGVGQIISGPFVGAMSDKLGRKSIMMVSFVGAGVCYGMMGLASSLYVLYGCRLVLGIVKQTISMGQAYVSDITTERERTSAMAFLSTSAALGFILGPILGSILARIHLRLPFVVAGVVFFVVSVTSYIYLPSKPPRPSLQDQLPRGHPRLPNSAVQQEATSEKGSSADSAADASSAEEVNTWCPVVGQTKGPMFDSTPRPFVERLQIAFSDFFTALREVQSQPFISRLLLVKFLCDVSNVLMQSCLLIFLQQRFGLTARSNGFFLAWNGLITIITNIYIVQPARRVLRGERVTLVLAFSIAAFSDLATCLCSSLQGFTVCVSFLTLGTTIASTCLTSILTQAAPGDKRGSILGLSASLQSLCRAVLPGIGGLLLFYSNSQVSVITEGEGETIVDMPGSLPFVVCGVVYLLVAGLWWQSSSRSFVRGSRAAQSFKTN